MNPSEAIEALLEAGATEAAIAAAVGVNQSTINRIKRGARPSFSVGSGLLALKASDLLGGDAEQEPQIAA